MLGFFRQFRSGASPSAGESPVSADLAVTTGEQVTLAALPKGAGGRIVAVEGDDAVAVRLLEMGLTEGETVTVLGFAPLGDPLELSVRGYRISLRRTEAQRVVIRTLPAGEHG